MIAASPIREHDLDLARRAAAGERDAQRELFLAQRAAVHHARAAIAAGGDDATALAVGAFVIGSDERDYSTAFNAFDRALALSPSSALALSFASIIGSWVGDDATAVEQARDAAARVRAFLPQAISEGIDALQAGARSFAFSLARLMAAALLLDEAQWNFQTVGDRHGCAVARRWCATRTTRNR